jgi:hypothetical protein
LQRHYILWGYFYCIGRHLHLQLFVTSFVTSITSVTSRRDVRRDVTRDVLHLSGVPDVSILLTFFLNVTNERNFQFIFFKCKNVTMLNIFKRCITPFLFYKWSTHYISNIFWRCARC